MLLDHVDYDLQRMRLMNALLLGGEQAFGAEFLPRINEIIRASRGTDYQRGPRLRDPTLGGSRAAGRVGVMPSARGR